MRGTLITEGVSLLQENTKVTSSAVTAAADPAAEVTHDSGSPQTYGILKYVVSSFGRDSVLLAKGSTLDPCYEIWESRGIPTDYLPS